LQRAALRTAAAAERSAALSGAFMRLCIFLAIAILSSSFSTQVDYEARNGDIIFHTPRSAQSVAIQMATNSPYSHMGIVYIRNSKPMV
jgi:hypothetical protein